MTEYLSRTFLVNFSNSALSAFPAFLLISGSLISVRNGLRSRNILPIPLGLQLRLLPITFLNRTWTFRSQDPDIATEYTEFIVISLVGWVCQPDRMDLIHCRLKQNFYLSKLFAIGMVTIWNFFANYYITFAIKIIFLNRQREICSV